MDVLVVRHGIALDREEARDRGISEQDRPLTGRGRSRLEKVVRGLARRTTNLGCVVTSPYRRALETASILALEYGDVEQLETPALLPHAPPEELTRFLAEQDLESPVAVVGHEPHLGIFMGYCLTGEPCSFLDLRKGGACLLRFDEAPGPRAAQLVWHLPPALSRRLT